MPIGDSELILNADGSIYHLNLIPEDISDTIILVGDPNRVPLVSRHFDSIDLIKQKREFLTHTGVCNGKKLTVLSTGIGAGNIDIVLNELDALVNIDLSTREVKKQHQVLNLIRIGTSGAIQPSIPVDSFLVSESAVGFDGILHFYKSQTASDAMENALKAHFSWEDFGIVPYAAKGGESLINSFSSKPFLTGITVTNGGFYGPQGRSLRLEPQLIDFHTKLQSFQFNGKQLTNLEMETATIYGLAQLLGHQALSLNAILANRPMGTFSKDPRKTVESLITQSLEVLT